MKGNRVMKGNLEYAEDVRKMGASLHIIDNGLKRRGVNFLTRLLIIHHLRKMKDTDSFTEKHLYLYQWVKTVAIIMPVTFFLTKIIGWYVYDVGSFFKYYPLVLSLIIYSLAFSLIFRIIYLNSKRNFNNHYVSYALDVGLGCVFGFLILSIGANIAVLSLFFSVSMFAIFVTVYGVELESAMFSTILFFGIFLILNYSVLSILEVLFNYAPILRSYLDSLGLERYTLNLGDL